MDQFTYRLFTIEKNRAAFDLVLRKVIDPVPDWSIDQHDSGQYFLKIRKGTLHHSSEGMGEGLISLFFLIDALYDSRPGDTIVVDEPELSLHPAIQKKLATLFVEATSDRQIVLATHSPYFVPMQALLQGGTIARVHNRDGASILSQASNETIQRLSGLLTNRNNPHILGLRAQEVFFMEDGVVLVEGQEDVVYFKMIEASAGISLRGSFYGWGVGGAGNMEAIAKMLRELGFPKVLGILDGNQAPLAASLEQQFPNFKFLTLPADDIRTKPAAAARNEVIGVLNTNNDAIRPEFIEAVRSLLTQANQYLG